MAEPTRLLCREKRNASKAKRLNPEPLPISEPLKSPHLKRRSAAPPERRSASLWGLRPAPRGLRPLPSTSAERRETRPGGPVRGRGRDGGCELRPELAAGASRTRRLALSTAPWIARRRDAHPPVVAPEVVHHVPGSDAGELEHRLHHLLRRRADRVRDTSNESRCQTAKPERGCPPHSLPARVTVVGTRWYSHLRKDDTATLGKVLPFFFFFFVFSLNRHDGEVEHDGEVGGFAGGDPRGCHLVNRGEDVVHVAARADDVVAPADHLRVTACTGMRDT